jgi:radical SAM protein with 4Fe4S-binding SPASM domain
MLDRLVVPSRFALICRGGETLGYNPGLNTWERLDAATAEVIRWLRARRDRAGLEKHLTLRFGHTEAAAKTELQRIVHWCILRRLLYLDKEPELPENNPAAAGQLFSVYWICTQSCNLRCTYCYQDATVARPNELTTEEGIELVNQVAESGARAFIITGGEPFNRRDLLKIAACSRRRGLVTNIITNGHYIRRSNIKEVAEIFNRVTISLDHGNPAHHDRARGEGSWASAASAIDLLLDAGVNVDVNSTLSRFGLDDVDELLQFVRKRRIGTHRIVPQYPMGRGADAREDELTPVDVLKLDDNLYRIHEELDARGDYQPRRESRGGDKLVRRNHCGAGLSEVSVDPEGWVYPCKLLQYPEFRAGNVRERRLAQIFDEHPILRTARQRTAETLIPCKSCIIRNHCGGGCRGIHFSFTHDYLKANPLFCASLRTGFETEAWASTGSVPAARKTDFVGTLPPPGQFVPLSALGVAHA